MKEKIKKIGLIIFYIFIWLLFIFNIVCVFTLVNAILEGSINSIKDWFIAIAIIVLPFLWSYLLRRHFQVLVKLIVRFLAFIKNIKLTLPATILLSCIILGGFFYASQVSKQRSIEKQQQIELKTKTEQQTKEYVAKRKKECYDLETSERKKWNNVDGSGYNEERDVCIVRYNTDEYKGVDCATKYKDSIHLLFQCELGIFTKEF